jgi:hypothetical protein
MRFPKDIPQKARKSPKNQPVKEFTLFALLGINRQLLGVSGKK